MGRLFLHRHFLFRCPAISGHHLLSICLFIFFFLSVSFQILSLLLSVPVSEGFPTVPPIFSLWYILIPWDNACIEAFHALIKREWLNRFKIFDYNHAYKLVFEYIETFYNTVRIHSHCDYLSPNEYEDKYWKELKNLELIVG